jgi:bifunctional DNA-binding transcriptional regulator/antitoxin component of YhaV-PrlF toxin-antitoxin module
MKTSVITSKGQTTVPSKIRDMLRWQRRQRLVWEPQKDGSAVVRPVPDVMALAGCLKSAARFSGIQEETAAATKAWVSDTTGERRG